MRNESFIERESDKDGSHMGFDERLRGLVEHLYEIADFADVPFLSLIGEERMTFAHLTPATVAFIASGMYAEDAIEEAREAVGVYEDLDGMCDSAGLPDGDIRSLLRAHGLHLLRAEDSQALSAVSQ